MTQPSYARIGQRLRSMLFGDEDAALSPVSGAGHAPAAPGHADRLNGLTTSHEFAEQLRSLVHDHGQVAVGRLQILGFQSVQARIGARWPQVEERVANLIQGTLKRRLNSGDVFRQTDALTYLVIFSGLSPEEARIKAQFIAEEVWQQLFGKPESADEMGIAILTVDLETHEVIPAMDMDTAMARLLERSGATVPADVSAAPPPAEHPAGPAVAPQAARSDEAEAAPRSAPAVAPDEDAPMPARSGLPSQGARGVQGSLTFTPVWMVSRHAVASYYCRLRVTRETDGTFYGHDIVGRDPAPREVYELDLTTLSRVSAAAMRLSDARAKAMLVLPVHYTSLINRDARRAFIERCAALPRQATQRIIMELVGFAEGFPPHLALELTHLLGPYCKELWAQIPPVPAAVTNLHEAGFHAIGFDARHVGTAARLSRVADRFVETARKYNMRTYAQCVPSPDMAGVGIKAGLDYMTGDAIHRPFDMMKPPFRLTPDDLPTVAAPAGAALSGGPDAASEASAPRD